MSGPEQLSLIGGEDDEPAGTSKAPVKDGATAGAPAVDADVAVGDAAPEATPDERPTEEAPAAEPAPVAVEVPAGEVSEDDSSADDSAAEEPAAQEVTAEKSSAGEISAEEASAEVPAEGEPAGEEPAGEEPAGEEPAGEEPAGEEPAAEEAAAETSAAEAPVDGTGDGTADGTADETSGDATDGAEPAVAEADARSAVAAAAEDAAPVGMPDVVVDAPSAGPSEPATGGTEPDTAGIPLLPPAARELDEPVEEPAPAPVPAGGPSDGSPEPASRTRARHRLAAAMRPRLTRSQLLAAVLCAGLGFGLVVQVRAQQKSDFSQLREDQLVVLLQNLDDQAAKLDVQEREARADRDRLLANASNGQAAEQEARDRLDTLGVLAGTVAATGPGIQLRIDDPRKEVSAAILLDTLQELRDAGAEAVQIGTVRVVASTYFEDTEGGVKVGTTELTPPYTYTVIGDAQTLDEAMQIPGGVLDTLKQKGATGTITRLERVDVTALHEVSPPQYARPAQGTGS